MIVCMCVFFVCECACVFVCVCVCVCVYSAMRSEEGLFRKSGDGEMVDKV